MDIYIVAAGAMVLLGMYAVARSMEASARKIINRVEAREADMEKLVKVEMYQTKAEIHGLRSDLQKVSNGEKLPPSFEDRLSEWGARSEA